MQKIKFSDRILKPLILPKSLKKSKSSLAISAFFAILPQNDSVTGGTRMPIRTSRAIKIPSEATGKAKKLPGKTTRKPIKKSTRKENLEKANLKAGSEVVVAGQFMQRGKFWCWATCARMVANSFAIGLSADEVPEQEQIVQEFLGSIQDIPQSLDRIEQLFKSGILGARIQCERARGSLFQQQILNEIGEDRPIEIGVTFVGGGHVVVIAGFVDLGDGTVNYILHDPANGKVVVSYASLCHASWLGVSSGNWVESFYRFSRM